MAETEYLLASSFAWAYDTAWTIAVGLNNSLKYLNETGLHDYTNNNYYLNAIMRGTMEVNFAGASVSISESNPRYVTHPFDNLPHIGRRIVNVGSSEGILSRSFSSVDSAATGYLKQSGDSFGDS